MNTRLSISLRSSSLSLAAMLAGLSLLGTLGCDDPGSRRPGLITPLGEENAGMDDSLVLNEHAYVVDAELGSDVFVAEDELVFYGGAADPSLARSPGDVLVNGSSTGFLRKVEAVEQLGPDVVFLTSEAALGDVFVKGGFEREFHPFSEGQALVVDEWGNPTGVLPPEGELPEMRSNGISFSNGRIDIDNLRLLSMHGVDVTLTKGHVAFDPSLNVSTEFGWWDIERFEIQARGSLDAELELNIHSDGYDKEIDETVKLWESPKSAYYTFVGPVPVVVVSQLELNAHAELTLETELDIDMGASASSFVVVGGVYEDGVWTKLNDHTFSYDFSGPTITATGELDAAVSLEAKLNVRFYDAVGPWISVAPGAKAHVEVGAQLDSLDWMAELGVDARFGGSVKLPGTEELGFEGTLFSWWHTFAQGTL